MKNLFSFAILLAFLFLLGGRIILYEAYTIQNREAMWKSIDNGSISIKETLIKLNAQDTKKLIDGNEITLYHRYDITRIDLKGNEVIVHAVNDAEEEKLLAGLNDTYLNSNHQNPLTHRSPISLLDDFFKEYTSSKNIKITPQQGLRQSYSFNQRSSIPEGFQRLYSPPPKIQAA